MIQLLDPWTGLEWERKPIMYYLIAIGCGLTSLGYTLAIARRAYEDTYKRPFVWLAVGAAYVFTALAFH